MNEATKQFIEFAEQAALTMPQHCHNPRFGHPLSKPGAWVLKFGPESLRYLKSEDIEKIRIDKLIWEHSDQCGNQQI